MHLWISPFEVRLDAALSRCATLPVLVYVVGKGGFVSFSTKMLHALLVCLGTGQNLTFEEQTSLKSRGPTESLEGQALVRGGVGHIACEAGFQGDGSTRPWTAAPREGHARLGPRRAAALETLGPGGWGHRGTGVLRCGTRTRNRGAGVA